MNRQLLAAAVGAGVFALSYLAFGLPILVSALAAAGAYVAGLFLFFARGKRGLEVRVGDPDAATVAQTLAEASAKVDGIAKLSVRIQKLDVKAKIDTLITIARGILDDIRKDPKDIRRARQFLNYYLDAVTRILGHYTDLTERGIGSADARAALEKVESLLLTLEGAFEKQRATLAQDDVLDLDSEISVLEKTLDMEGLKL
jgi:5-bromo-4-chloroindolyl phosphate hydrolysis protein